MSDDLLTVSQAAEALNASGQSVRNWIRAERLRAVRIGARFLIPVAEVERMRAMVRDVVARESPWESAENAPVAPLPRAGAGVGAGVEDFGG